MLLQVGRLGYEATSGPQRLTIPVLQIGLLEASCGALPQEIWAISISTDCHALSSTVSHLTGKVGTHLYTWHHNCHAGR